MNDCVAAGGEPRHHLRQIVEAALAGDEHVERGIGEQRQREAHAAACVPSRALRRRDAADLRRSDRQPPSVERFAERHGHRAIAVPAQLDDRRLERGDLERALQAGLRAARVNHHVAIAARVLRRGEPDAERARDRRARRVHVHELDVARGDARGEPRRHAADGARADNRHAIADADAGVPHAVDGRLEIRCKHRARRRDAVGDEVRRRGGHDVAGLVRIEHENAPPLELGGAALDRADAGVPVLHGRGKRAFLKRRAHARAFARRHAPLEDERLGAAADGAEQRADLDLMRPGRGDPLGADLTSAGRGDPERASLVARHVLTI